MFSSIIWSKNKNGSEFHFSEKYLGCIYKLLWKSGMIRVKRWIYKQKYPFQSNYWAKWYIKAVVFSTLHSLTDSFESALTFFSSLVRLYIQIGIHELSINNGERCCSTHHNFNVTWKSQKKVIRSMKSWKGQWSVLLNTCHLPAKKSRHTKCKSSPHCFQKSWEKLGIFHAQALFTCQMKSLCTDIYIYVNNWNKISVKMGKIQF